jgi:hypothetical protein
MTALPFNASDLTQRFWFQFCSIFRNPLPKENGFTEWWAQHHSEFAGLSELQAKTIFDAGQKVVVGAIWEIRQHVKTIAFLDDESQRK